MKKIFEYIGLFSVVCFSFFMTDKTINVAKQMDSIMIDIKNNKNDYKVPCIESIINKDTLIPGINGIEVNINKSYINMKQVGIYDSSLFIYDSIKVSNEIKNNLDKYIVNGNKQKKMISIILSIEDIDIERILNKIGNYKLNFLVSEYYLENNNEEIKKLIELGHNIIISDSNIKKYVNYMENYNQEKLYCFNKNKDSDFLNICMNNSAYSLYSDNIINNNYLIETKRSLENGKFIILNGNINNYIVSIINYIESKGYKIVNIDKLLNEFML